MAETMKLIYHGESSLSRQFTRKLSDPQNSFSYISIHPSKAMQAETSAAESVSCSDVPTSPAGRMWSASAHVNPTYEDARASDANGYYRVTIEKLKCENLAKRLLSVMLKLAAVFRYIPYELSRSQNTVIPLRPREDESRCSLISTPREPTMKDRIFPCLERIQKLEKQYDDIRNKPVAMPVEKERMLMDSLDRIKSVEFDLVKTKRLLHATVVKQMEITEMLQNLRESQLHRRRRLFC